MYNLPLYVDRCSLNRLETLTRRRFDACMMFIYIFLTFCMFCLFCTWSLDLLFSSHDRMTIIHRKIVEKNDLLNLDLGGFGWFSITSYGLTVWTRSSIHSLHASHDRWFIDLDHFYYMSLNTQICLCKVHQKRI
jgi:hypothetical protein